MQTGIGRSVVVKGDVTAAEDLVIGGRVEGSVSLTGNTLTVLEGSELHASIEVKSAIVIGTIVGIVEAGERLELREGSNVKGDITSPRIVMVDGATVNGTVAMPKRG